MSILVSPAEPAEVKRALERCGLDIESSPHPERFGVDIAWRAHGSWWGAQRKTIADFVASLHDGRLQREAAQMASHVSMPTIILEGRPQFTATSTPEGTQQVLIGSWQEVTRRQWQSMMWTLASHGIGVTSSSNIHDTAQTVAWMVAWTEKTSHTSLTRRPKMVDSKWGKPTNRDFGVHLLQGFDGVGPELAGAIFDHFGRVPLDWAEGAALEDVPGIGPGRAKKLRGALS